MPNSSRLNLVLAIAATMVVGVAACQQDLPTSANQGGGKTSSGGGSGQGGSGGSGGGSGASKTGGAGGALSSSGGSTTGGSSGGVSVGGSSGGSAGGASSGGSTSSGVASGGSGGRTGGSGGGSGGSSGGAGAGGAAGAGGSAGTGGGTGGSQGDAGPDAGKADVVGADRPDGLADLSARDTVLVSDAPGTDAACSVACATGQTCVSGLCLCSNGLAACGADCIDLGTSTSHCGACDIVCGTGQICNQGACVEGGSSGGDGCSNDLASNLTLKQIAVYQSVKIPVMQDGTEVAAASRNASVVPGRDTLFRVFATLGSGFAARELAARLTLTPAGGTAVQYYSKKTLSGSSVDSDTKTTFQIFVPASAMAASLRYSVEVVECGTSPGSPGQARFPQSGDIELGTKNTGGLKIKIIPITAGSYSPDTSATALTAYASYMRAMYPINGISITVGDTITTPTPVDWEVMLDAIRAKRTSDKAPNDVYYFGLVKPADTFDNYCRSSCTTGIGFVVTTATGSSTAQGRSAVGVAYGDRYSWETMAHEVGHNHGRNHAPCVTGGGTISGVDSKFPYTSGGLGTWGYDARTQKLYDPAKSKDIMGYCTTNWVSDYTYVGLTTRVAGVNGATLIYTPDSALSRWRILLAGSRGPRWGTPITDLVPAEGAPEQATIYDSAGVALTNVVVYRTEISEGFGAMYMVPEPQPGWYAVSVAGGPVLIFAP